MVWGNPKSTRAQERAENKVRNWKVKGYMDGQKVDVRHRGTAEDARQFALNMGWTGVTIDR